MSNQFLLKKLLLLLPFSLDLERDRLNGALCSVCVGFRLIVRLRWYACSGRVNMRSAQLKPLFPLKSYDNGVISLQTSD